MTSLGAQVIPRIQSLSGYRGTMSLIDRATGRSLSITFWDDTETLSASRAAAEQIRERAAATSGSRIVEVVEEEVGFTDLLLPPAGELDSSPAPL